MSGFFEMFQQPSEEQIAEYNEAMKRQQIAQEEFRHSVQRLFEELPEDQLTTLKTMLACLIHSDGHTASQWEGMIAMSLKHRFNICVTCGVNHDKEFDGEQDIPEGVSEPAPPRDVFPPLERPTYQRGEEPIPELDYLDGETRILANEYHVDDVRDANTQEIIHWACTGIVGMKEGCGVTYPSLEDRMLRSPEHCSGCFVRMGQG